MNAIFLKILNMSIAASWIVPIVLVLRLVLRKAPKWTSCLLWAILALRLILPVSLESAVSLIPSAEVIPVNITQAETPAIYSGIPEVNSAVNPVLTQHMDQPGILAGVLDVVTIVWLAGMGIMLVYSVISWLLLRRQVRASLRYRDRVFVCDDIQSPFVLGVFSPRIYIPSGMSGESLRHVLAHEMAHIQRRDYLWKPLGYLLLSIYWFNPLLWLAYILLCRDIERACDEKVLRSTDESGKVGYVKALADCSTHRRMILCCPVAFGEVSVVSRIKSALHYKRPALWVVVLALAACLVVTVCFLTDPIPCVHAYSSELAFAPTCTESGMETRTCKHCQHSYAVRVDMCPHTAGELVVLTAPTCTETGEAATVCTECQTPFTVILPVDNTIHNMTLSATVAATCTAPGSQQYTCTRCGKQEGTEIPKLEHQYEQRVTRFATCTSTGKTENRCVQCGHTFVEKISRKDHTWVHWYNNVYRCHYCFACKTTGSGSGYSLLDDTVGSKPTGVPQLPSIQIWP